MSNIIFPSLCLFCVNIAVVHLNIIQSICNHTEVQLSLLINQTLNAEELPADLLALATGTINPNVSLEIQNCSNILTLKRFLYDYNVKPSMDDQQKRYFSALYAYVEFTNGILSESQYIPKNHSDILVLINSFSSSSLNPNLGRGIYSYFSHYGNWTETLIKSNFSFEKYNNPRDLLLGMICTLIRESKSSLHEREALSFLLENKYICPIFKNLQKSKWPIEEAISEGTNNGWPKSQEVKSEAADDTFLKQQFLIGKNSKPNDERISTNNTSGSRWDTLEKHPTFDLWALDEELSYNENAEKNLTEVGFPTRLKNGTVLPNYTFKMVSGQPRLFFNASVISLINLRKFKELGKNHNKSNRTEQKTTYLGKYLTPAYDVQHLSSPLMELINSTLVTVSSKVQYAKESFTTVPLPTIFESTSPNISKLDDSLLLLNFTLNRHNSTNGYFHHDGNKDMPTVNVWDVVEIDGPCQEGQQYLVKLNVHSLLTAIDGGAPNASLELFRKLLPAVEQFPIQDYNARGQLLRDLIPAISKQQADPAVRKKIEVVLDHIILDGAGALPPKVKLECADVTASDLERIRRRTKRVFLLEYN